ncbi:response regulator [Exilibacterium tricleocarpae]|uniref:histidine kinase n=1 Tax=Exilibacterium tricleocarpae TaxID=2591008 RepID=A0A545TVM1_9GAMM|nr:response regulator [Exilibacterium tricleocarpae]TQV81265.1 response regulator [Exilibacterium tricleocarpae]
MLQLQLFVPQSKVQKDRKVMRDTDSRMAKYSRRGIVLNFLAFLLCLGAGSFLELAQELAMVLLLGLLLITLVRGYFLFRFDALYPRAPARWRNQYFIVSFIGAAWWSFILVSVTSVVGMRNETPLLWLYTVVFYSATANAFAPYRQFVTYYQFIGQVPAAVAALLLGTPEGYLYGAMMLVFYLMLYHQGRGVCDAFWDRLEANYTLKQKAESLEEEKRDTQATVELNNEFMTNLGHEFRTSLNDVIGALSLLEDSQLTPKQRDLLTLAEKASERQLHLVNNVMDFSRITARELVLDVSVFNLRRHIETIIAEVASEAHQQGVALNHIIDPALPMRARGDAERLGQMLSHLISNAVKFSERGEVTVEAGFKFSGADEGELSVTVSDEGQAIQIADEEEMFDAFATADTTNAGTGLGLAICKGLAECMGGSVGTRREEQGSSLWLKVRLQLAGEQPQVLVTNPKLKGRRILLVGTPAKIVDSTLQELESWGLAPEAVDSHETALRRLDAASDSEHPFDAVLIYNQLQRLDGLTLSNTLCRDTRLADLKQILVITALQSEDDDLRALLAAQPQVSTLTRPLFRQPLHDLLNQLLFDTAAADKAAASAGHNHSQGLGQTVLLVEDHRVNQMVAEGMLKKLGYGVKVANNGREALDLLAGAEVDLVLMDCQMPEMDGFVATQRIRNLEARGTEDRHIPIIAMTAHAAEGDETRCLAAGMDDYLPKPVRYDQLESRLKRWLGG